MKKSPLKICLLLILLSIAVFNCAQAENIIIIPNNSYYIEDEIMVSDEYRMYVMPYTTAASSADSRYHQITVPVKIQNLRTEDVTLDELITASLHYRDKFEYPLDLKGYAFVLDPTVVVNNYTLDPLAEMIMLFKTDVPNVVAESEDSLLMKFSIDGTEYDISLR